MKKIYAVIIAAAMLLSFCLGVGASNGLEEINALLNRGITIKMDGQAQEMYDANGQRVYPISYNGTTYLPVRAVSNMLGLGVAWDEAANSVLLTSGGAVSTSKTLAAGATVGDTYINEFIGIGFKLPAGWRFATDEEIEALTAGGALLVGENLEDRMAKTGFFCDMIAQSEEGEFVVLTIEKKTELAKILGFEEAFNFSMEYTKEQLTSDVYKDITLTPRDIQIGNLVCKGYDIEGTVYGIKNYQGNVMIDLGDYTASINVSSVKGKAETDNIWNNFFSL